MNSFIIYQYLFFLTVNVRTEHKVHLTSAIWTQYWFVYLIARNKLQTGMQEWREIIIYRTVYRKRYNRAMLLKWKEENRK